jgi:hypothetical protein
MHHRLDAPRPDSVRSGDLMQHVEMRDYCGDYEDIAEFWHRVWIPEYGGKMWVTAADAAFFRWLVGPQSGALCPVAYDGTKLVGSLFSVPHSLRIGSSVHDIGLAFGLTVGPDHRRFALPLIERLHRDNAERGFAFTLGTVVNDPTSPSNRFWTKYAQAFPQNLSFLFPVNYWAKGLAPGVLARAGIKRWERMAMQALGPLIQLTPHRHDPHVRSYQSADLEQCAQILHKSSAGFDWALTWPPEQLTHRLEGPTCGTLVFERDGCVRGMVNYYCLSMQGRERVLAAVIALWADDGLTGAQRVRLLSHVCNHLRERGVHLVTAPRCAMMPAPAFLANLFFPVPGPWHLVALWPKVPLPLPKTWSLLVM